MLKGIDGDEIIAEAGLMHFYRSVETKNSINNNIKNMKLFNFLSGYKTFIVGIAGLIFGVYNQNTEIIITSLGLIGLRQAISKL